MKKTLLAAAMIFASGSVMAADGGQIDFNGLVQSGTCKVGVADGGKQSITSDGVVTLNTANVTDTFPTVSETSVGLLPKEFKISVDCAPASNSEASLTMSSISFANTSGTLNNNMNVTVNGLAPAENVNIAVHNMTNKDGAPEIKQVHMNDASNVQLLKLNADGDGQYLFNASYVKAPTGSAVTAGHVTTNAMYTIIYN